MSENEVSDAIDARRAALGMSLTDLSRIAVVSDPTLRRVRNGERPRHRTRTFRRVEKALDWPDGVIDRLIDGEMTVEQAAAAHRPPAQPPERPSVDFQAAGVMFRAEYPADDWETLSDTEKFFVEDTLNRLEWLVTISKS